MGKRQWWQTGIKHLLEDWLLLDGRSDFFWIEVDGLRENDSLEKMVRDGSNIKWQKITNESQAWLHASSTYWVIGCRSREEQNSCRWEMRAWGEEFENMVRRLNIEYRMAKNNKITRAHQDLLDNWLSLERRSDFFWLELMAWGDDGDGPRGEVSCSWLASEKIMGQYTKL